MYQAPNRTTTQSGAASLLVAALEHTWQAIRSRHYEVPEAVLVVASGSEGKRLNLGHFAPHRWQVNGADRHEVLVGGEGLHRGPVDVLGTLLHEAAHGLAQARCVTDTSRQGRYHNRRYAALASELGLEVASVTPIGWSATTVPATTANAYAAQLEELAAALVLWRRQEHRTGSGTRSRNLLAAICGCGRRIRVAKATLAEALILCGRGPSCDRPAKHPLVRHGVKEARTDPDRIGRWWRRWPLANLGLATGVVFDALDVDGPAGLAALRQLAPMVELRFRRRRTSTATPSTSTPSAAAATRWTVAPPFGPAAGCCSRASTRAARSAAR